MARKKKKTSSGRTPFVERMNQAHVDEIKKEADLLEHKERMEQMRTNYYNPAGGGRKSSHFYPRRASPFYLKDLVQRDAGGPVKRNSRDGYARGGLTKVPHDNDNAALMQAGGYLGGLTETGRGTMAGELGRRGDMSVREAGETMHELARRRGYEAGGGVGSAASPGKKAPSSYNRPYNQKNK